MVIKKTKSLCPECLRVVDAEVFEDQEKIMIKKTCPEHGEFENTYWQSSEAYFYASDFNYTGEGIENPRTDIVDECPLNCGICTEESNCIGPNRCNQSL